MDDAIATESPSGAGSGIALAERASDAAIDA